MLLLILLSLRLGFLLQLVLLLVLLLILSILLASLASDAAANMASDAVVKLAIGLFRLPIYSTAILLLVLLLMQLLLLLRVLLWLLLSRANSLRASTFGQVRQHPTGLHLTHWSCVFFGHLKTGQFDTFFFFSLHS